LCFDGINLLNTKLIVLFTMTMDHYSEYLPTVN